MDHKEYLQSILLEYDLVRAPTELTMLKYLRKGLKPSILTELEYQDLELESFNQIVKKAVNTRAKVVLRPRSNTREIDQNCPRGYCSTNSIIAKSQSSVMKNL